MVGKALRTFVAGRQIYMPGEEVPDEVARTLGASGLVEGYPLPEEDASDGDGLPDLPADLNIPDTIDWIGDGDDQASRAALALASENASETPRSSLITQLEALATTEAGG